MDLGQLRYFVKIVEHGSFTRAAKDCSVSQPALSQQIAKLERELGQPLFERQGRSIRITPAGKTLHRNAEKILQLADDVKRQITDDGESGRIALSAIPTVGPYLLPKLLRDIGDQFAGAQFSISEDVTEELLKRCASGDIDVGLLALPAGAKYVSVQPLFEEELMLVLPKEHRLVQKPKVTVDDIRNEPFVLLNEVHCLVEHIESFCNENRFQPLATARIQQLATVINLVALGHGVSLIPDMACQSAADNGVVFRRLDIPRPKRTVAVCWNPNRYQSRLVANFLEALRGIGDRSLSRGSAAAKEVADSSVPR